MVIVGLIAKVNVVLPGGDERSVVGKSSGTAWRVLAGRRQLTRGGLCSSSARDSNSSLSNGRKFSLVADCYTSCGSVKCAQVVKTVLKENNRKCVVQHKKRVGSEQNRHVLATFSKSALLHPVPSLVSGARAIVRQLVEVGLPCRTKTSRTEFVPPMVMVTGAPCANPSWC
ncbi:hypothetical protein E2C01_043909 [Portunus trituberculatus]|uniref:Uncharacterized protein n=1 Tax=Portunus trituberculatus TaxID=210409 RepID=A0A5B7FXE3_PORTR|nr:hypothetical protein [Portunus trituberculatus]